MRWCGTRLLWHRKMAPSSFMSVEALNSNSSVVQRLVCGIKTGKVLGHLLWENENGPLSVRPTLELSERLIRGNFWETGSSTYAGFPECFLAFLNWTELVNTLYRNGIWILMRTSEIHLLPSQWSKLWVAYILLNVTMQKNCHSLMLVTYGFFFGGGGGGVVVVIF